MVDLRLHGPDRHVRTRRPGTRIRPGHQAGTEDRQASREGCARAEEACRARRRHTGTAARAAVGRGIQGHLRPRRSQDGHANFVREQPGALRARRHHPDQAARSEQDRANQPRREHLPDHAGRRGSAAAAVAAARAPTPKPPGLVNVINVSIIDMGERKTAFDREARRVQDRDRSAPAARRVRSSEAGDRD